MPYDETLQVSDGAARVAAVDIGSNTIRLMVADVEVAGGVATHRPLLKESRITRLAEGVDARGILLPAPIARTRNALAEYRSIAREHDAVYVLATATSAVRDADNGEAFLGEVTYSYGFDTELLAGTREAEWTWRGVTSDADFAQDASSGTGLLLDIGGGSTELLLTRNGSIVDHDSLQLGSVRLTEQQLDSPSDDGSWNLDQVDDATTRARNIIGERFATIEVPNLAIGVAGTVTTVAAVTQQMATYDSQRIHRSVITRAQVVGVRDRLAQMPLADRRAVPGLEPQRAEVIVGGLCILAALFEHAGIDQMRVSECDILDGIALAAGIFAIASEITELPETFGRTSC